MQKINRQNHAPQERTAFLLAVVLLSIVLAIFLFHPIGNVDIFMYLAWGRELVREMAWPTVDPFLYSLKGHETPIKHEWLSYVGFYGAYQLAGYPALVVTKVALFLIGFLFPAWLAWRGRTISWLWPLLAILAVFPMSQRFSVRSSLFGDLFLLLTIFYSLKVPRVSFWLPLIFVIWANTHPSYPMGWGVLISATLYYGLARETQAAKRLLKMTTICVAVSFLHLGGPMETLYPFQFLFENLSSSRQHIAEWQPIWHESFASVWQIQIYYLLPVIAAIGLCLSQQRKNLLYWLFLFGFTSLALVSSRFILTSGWALLTLVALLEIRPLARERAFLCYAPSMILTVALLIILLFFQTPGGDDAHVNGWGLDKRYFSEAGVEFLKKTPLSANVFNSYSQGGFLAWQWDEKNKVFYHSFLADLDFYERDYVGVIRSEDEFQRVVRDYNIGVFYLSKLSGYSLLEKVLQKKSDWQRVYSDRAVNIYFLKDPKVLHP